jgi:hypothetical protein
LAILGSATKQVVQWTAWQLTSIFNLGSLYLYLQLLLQSFLCVPAMHHLQRSNVGILFPGVPLESNSALDASLIECKFVNRMIQLVQKGWLKEPT